MFCPKQTQRGRTLFSAQRGLYPALRIPLCRMGPAHEVFAHAQVSGLPFRSRIVRCFLHQVNLGSSGFGFLAVFFSYFLFFFNSFNINKRSFLPVFL
jgi:hypothetical protein